MTSMALTTRMTSRRTSVTRAVRVSNVPIVRLLPLCTRRQRQMCISLGSMYVPSDSFGGLSPEKKSSNALRNLFTFIAVRVILAQLEGSGRGSNGSYNSEAYALLSESIHQVPLKDGDEWIAQLMKRSSSLAFRVMEVRDAYCTEEFEWDVLKRIAIKDTKEANLKLMRDFAAQSLSRVTAEEPVYVPPATTASSGRAGRTAVAMREACSTEVSSVSASLPHSQNLQSAASPSPSSQVPVPDTSAPGAAENNVQPGPHRQTSMARREETVNGAAPENGSQSTAA